MTQEQKRSYLHSFYLIVIVSSVSFFIDYRCPLSLLLGYLTDLLYDFILAFLLSTFLKKRSGKILITGGFTLNLLLIVVSFLWAFSAPRFFIWFMVFLGMMIPKVIYFLENFKG